MTELRDAIRALQGAAADALAQRAFAAIADMSRREPRECAVELSRAILEEQAAGALQTPRLLTLLGLTREPVPECVALCLDLVRALADAPSSLPADAALGAAAIVARIEPRALLPDLVAVTGSQTPEIDARIARALWRLLAISRIFLRELPDSAITEMARWLWCDCAAFDLMTLADFVAMHVEQSGAGDPIVPLMVDLVDRVPVGRDAKHYASQRLQEAGADAAVIEQLEAAWRAIRVAPPDPAAAEPREVADPEPPPPEPRDDEWLVRFADGDADDIASARDYIAERFEYGEVAALAWWLAVTADSLPPPRRRTDIALTLLIIYSRSYDRPVVPPSLLRRWLDTPQLLSALPTQIALDLLGRQQPAVVVQRYLHRAVAASDGYAKVMGGLWRALTEADPAAVLAVASRWNVFGFGKSEFLQLLIDVLIERVRIQPKLIETLRGSLAGEDDEVVDAALKLLDHLRRQVRGGSIV